MIPANIRKEHIEQAIDYFAAYGYPENRAAVHYLVFHNGTKFPVKVVIDLAEWIALGEQLLPGRTYEYLRSKTSAFNSQQARKYLTALGFEIIGVNDDTRFFTKDDLLNFQHIAGTSYVKDDEYSEEMKRDATRVWTSTKDWGKLVADRTGLTIEGNMMWLERGDKKKKAPKIKKYSWYRLVRDGIFGKQVFFTVGVSGPEARLEFKLDCMRSGKDALPPSLVVLFDSFLRENEIQTMEVYADKIQDWNWNSLVSASIDYYEQKKDKYEELLSVLKAANVKVFARICFNEFGWMGPSGRKGKSRTSKTVIAHLQEREYGYAPDEWLFAADRLYVDEFHYARVEPLNDGVYVGRKFDITFYCQDGISKKWFWVGEVRNAEVVNPETSVKVSQYYREQGWLAQQINELKSLPGIDWGHYEALDGKDRFNLRFRFEDCELYDNAPFDGTEKPPITRYRLVGRTFDPLRGGDLIMAGIGSLDFSSSGNKEGGGGLIQRNYKGGCREIENIHSEIQKEFLHQFGNGNHSLFNYYREVNKKKVNLRIDIVGQSKSGGEDAFYEIKTYPDAKHSIRVAVGQLLEYALFPNLRLCGRFYIVSHIRAGESELQYLRHLSGQLGLHFGFIHFDRKDRTFDMQLCAVDGDCYDHLKRD